MTRSADPADIDHPQLREFALQAVWVAQLEEATGVLEELMTDLADDDDRTGRAPWEADPLETAWSVVQTTFEEADRELEARVTEWLAARPGTLADLPPGSPRSLARAARAVAQGGSGVGTEPRDEHGARALSTGPVWSATGNRLESQ